MLTVLAQSMVEKQRKMVEGCRPGIKWSQGAQQVPNLFKSPSFTCSNLYQQNQGGDLYLMSTSKMLLT